MFYGQRLLEVDPKNAFALVTLAGETARHTREFDLDKEEKLTKADKWAKDGIEAAKTMPKVRPDITDEQWEGARKDIQAQGYEALGMAAALRKKFDDSIADYKQAIAMAASPDPGTYLRLGQTYIDAGKLDEADRRLRQGAGRSQRAAATEDHRAEQESRSREAQSRGRRETAGRLPPAKPQLQ